MPITNSVIGGSFLPKSLSISAKVGTTFQNMTNSAAHRTVSMTAGYIMAETILPWMAFRFSM
jgi:hypothetical protein